MESFKTRAVELPGAKATDFLSRLRGFVDVLGPNPMDAQDETFVLRRALLLRAPLLGRSPHLARGRATEHRPRRAARLSRHRQYLHGARSMESIIAMSALAGRLRYERSALPAHHQLGLHVDADAFLALVQREAAG